MALMAGIGRTAMAMAWAGDLPRILGRTSPTTGVPHIAEAVVGVAAIAFAWWADLGFALAMSSASVLTYYAIAIANAAAFAARWRATGFAVPRAVSAVGLVLCLALALSLDHLPMLAAVGAGVLAGAVRAVVLRVRRRGSESWRASRG